MTTESPAKSPRCKSPSGMDSMRRIGLNLTQDERIAVEEAAKRDGRTVSAMSRMLVLRGLKAFNAEQANAA